MGTAGKRLSILSEVERIGLDMVLLSETHLSGVSLQGEVLDQGYTLEHQWEWIGETALQFLLRTNTLVIPRFVRSMTE